MRRRSRRPLTQIGLRTISAKAAVRAGAAAAVAALLVAAPIPLPVAWAEAPSFFEGTASADAVDVVVSPGNQLLGQTREVGGLIAQARVDSFGTSTAFASHPYPSDAVTGQLGANYPFFVSTSYPAVPKQTSDNAGSHLSAASEQSTSQARASGSPQVPLSDVGSNESSVKVTAAPDGSITATADAWAKGISVAGVLNIADVRSHAAVTRTASGRIARTSSLNLGAITVAGQSAALTDRGLEAAGQTLPLAFDAVTQALEQGGLSVKLIKAEQKGDVAAAPAVQITYAAEVPKVGPFSASILLGYASASLSTEGDVPPPQSAGPGAGPVPGPSPQPDAVQGPTVSPGSVPSGGTGLSLPPSIAPGPVQRPVALSTVLQPLPPYSWLSLYVLTLAGALTVGLGGHLLRLLGVRAR